MPLTPPTRSMARPGNGSPPVPQFQTAEDYAAHLAALNSGPTGMYEKDTIQSGPHKGKTPNQVYAHYLGQASSQGLPSRSASAGQPSATREQNIAAAKADGSYDAKRAAYNATGATTGHTMDAAGNIKREGTWVSGNQKGSQIFVPKIASNNNGGAVPLPEVGDGGNGGAVPLPKVGDGGNGGAVPLPQVGDGGNGGAVPLPQVGGSQTRDQAAQFAQKNSEAAMGRAKGQQKAEDEKWLAQTGAVASKPFSSMGKGRNLAAEESARQGPGLGQRLQARIASAGDGPVITNGTPPTPPKLGPAAQALADFNAAPVAGTNLTGADIKTGAAGVAQQNTNVAKVQATIANAQTTLNPEQQGRQLIARTTGDQWDAAAKLPAQPKPAQPPPIATPAPAVIAGAGFQGPAGIEAAKKAVQLAANPERGAAPNTPPLQPKMATVPGQGPRVVTPPKIAPKVVANLPARANGGPVTAGQPYLVGEKGPEVVVPQTSGTVIPNHALPKPDLTPKPTHMNAASNLGMPAGTPSRPSRPLSNTRNWRMPTSPRTTATWKPQPPRLLAIN